MMKYYAIRPRDLTNATRIEKAATPRDALRMAFGVQPMAGKITGEFYSKDLGTTVGILRSNKRRIAALTAAEGWERIT